MVLRRNVDVVDVEQDAATAALGHLCQKIPLGEFGALPLEIARYVFDQDAALEPRLQAVDAFAYKRQRFVGIRQWQQIIEVPVAHRGPAKML